MAAPALPDAYLVGAPKAGTTSLAAWLGQHPDVFFSVPKEPYHWAADYPGLRAHYGFADRAAYEALFAGPAARRARLRAEGSTVYLYSERAVPDILRNVPHARFVVALRDPVDLVVSMHRTQLIALNEDEPDFARAWRRSVAGGLPATRLLDPKLVDYPRAGRLGAALARLLAAAPRDRVHLVRFDDLVADPRRVWRDLTAFLDLTAQPAPDFVPRNSSAKAVRFDRFHRLTHRPPARLVAPAAVLRQWTRTTSLPGVRWAKAALWKPAPPPRATPEVRAEVCAHLAPDLELLSGSVPFEIGHWGRP